MIIVLHNSSSSQGGQCKSLGVQSVKFNFSQSLAKISNCRESSFGEKTKQRFRFEKIYRAINDQPIPSMNFIAGCDQLYAMDPVIPLNQRQPSRKFRTNNQTNKTVTIDQKATSITNGVRSLCSITHSFRD